MTFHIGVAIFFFQIYVFLSLGQTSKIWICWLLVHEHKQNYYTITADKNRIIEQRCPRPCAVIEGYTLIFT